MENCFHCGDACDRTVIKYEEKHFCCHGCKTVFDILNENDLSYYYDLQQTPGITPSRIEGKYDFLENKVISDKLLEFNEQGIQVVTLLIPSIHCSSCIWVLENLNKLNPAVKTAQVDFPKKTVRVTYSSTDFSLHDLVSLLARLGYDPYISLEDASKKKNTTDRTLIYKLGIAGFAFGNIMFLSFPEYFKVDEFWLERYKHVFRWVMFAFSLPVVFYAGWGYFVSAYKGLRSKILNIDVPIAIGVFVLFVRSSVEIIMDWGSGFFDSLAGLIFFLLLGKFFQQKTYAFLSFERDYKSYFPIAVTRLLKKTTSVDEKNTSETLKKEEQAQVYELEKGDRIIIRNSELIPVDAILIKGNALIDYSFVTGEAEPVVKKSGDYLYAGGRQQAGVIELEVLKPVEQSYLTQLWSNEVFSKNKQSGFESLTDQISKRFTITLLLIAFVSTTFWLFYDKSIALNVFTSVLIVACPCAIALAAPFTLGNLLRIFGRNKCYIKNSKVIEQLSHIDTVVFDKTGTLTTNQKNGIVYEGVTLSEDEKLLLTSTLRASNHPLSRALYTMLNTNGICTLDSFNEEVGKGIEGVSRAYSIKVGSYAFVTEKASVDSQVSEQSNINKTTVHIGTNEEYKGCFVFSNEYRTGMSDVFEELSQNCKLVVLSGDNNGEQDYLKQILPKGTTMLFNQKPKDKLEYVKTLQEQGKNVLMVGDGLNDSGALAQSNVGIVISENVNVFSPACDGILDASRFKQITTFLTLSRQGIKVINYAFIFSLFYNLIGLGFAVTGHLAPVVAAILMPLSSISIVVFTTVYTYVLGRKLNLINNKVST
ncbi:MAG: heavy metal translocating P-type ATPase metal-binding domain-containing protein [Bizionia sp.]|nr:heavy metal translocating P-type ATPase metal-binding domain-containing protein [Bizionia sp.]